jgi:endonuclease G
MKKFYISSFALTLLAVWFVFSFNASAQSVTGEASAKAALVSPNLVISQFQVAGASALDEFVELHNTSSSAVDLNGYRVVYRSAAGVNDVAMVEWTTSTIVPSGGYYLIATTGYDGTPASNINYNTSTVSMAAAGGGIAIRNGAVNTGVIIDSVAYGTATNAFIESAVTSAPATNASQSRLSNGCQDTDSNASDFAATNPSAPRNADSAVSVCSGGGGGAVILAGGGASPNTVAPGASTLLTVTVFPATNPPSTGITVTGNLTDIGGAATQAFFDDGTNGDVTANDNTFSFSYTIPAATTGGVHNVTAVAADAQTRTANVNIALNINAVTPGEDPLLLGNPSNATADTANENNYLMIKPQYSLAYSRANATPNWVAWRLDTSWVGTAPRQDDYRPDPALPTDWYHVTDTDYSGSGYDRGHMCPSGDRTNTIPNNSATFLMTNFVPQLAANNQGAWEDFESYCRTLASQGNEIYIIDGPSGNIGTISQGRIVVPKYTWKVALVLPNGTNDLQRINKQTRTIAMIVPNQPPININAVWRTYRTTIKAVESLTGYKFFTNVPANTRLSLVQRRDNQ